MYVVCLLSNYDLEDLQFVLIFRRYFKLQRRIGQLQHISSKCCPGLPDLRAPALVIFYHRSHIKVVLSRVARRMLLCVVGQGHDRWHVHVVVNVISYFMEPGLSRGPGVEVERVVPEVWYSSRMVGSRSGEVVAELKSKRRGRRGSEVH